MIRISMSGGEIARSIAQRAGDLSPALEQIGAMLVESVRRNFDEGGRPEKWEPLKGKNAARTPLVKTGGLRDSIRAALENGAIELQSPLPYASFQQEGTRTIPARPFLVVQEEDYEKAGRIIAGYLQKKCS